MMKNFYAWVIRHPRLVIAVVAVVTVILALQLHKLRWETDARVYLPKGHPAIMYDEKVADTFGVKDAVIIGIVNEEKGVFNHDTLARIARITEKVAALPGVIATRGVDVASLSTATIFVGTDTSMGTEMVMPRVPEDEQGIARVKEAVYANADLFVGNLVSADGAAAMIRARLKEGQANRYMTYWQIRGIIDAEEGKANSGWSGQSGGNWPRQGGTRQNQQQWEQGPWGQEGSTPETAASPNQQTQTAPTQAAGANPWWPGGDASTGQGAEEIKDNGDRFYLAGRPVIEVTSGMHAMEDMQVMIPLLLLALAGVLCAVYRTLRGVVLPLCVMAAAVVWTLGGMALFDVPLYTISTMLPVILVAVGIGDAVHILSHYYDHVLEDPQKSSGEIVAAVMDKLGAPVILTSLTTAIGFLTFLFADMPPFKVFGLFTVLGILFSWLLSVTLLPAALTVLKPKVGGYLAKRRSMRMHAEQSWLTRALVRGAELVSARSAAAGLMVMVLATAAILGAARLFVDSSWLSDFRKDSELVQANEMLNKKFAGTIFLNAVIEGGQADVFKSPEMLRHMEALQRYVEGLPHVGSSLSLVDYVKSMNKTLHAGDEAYDTLPRTRDQIAEYLFLFSVSGRPQQLDEIVDYDYRRALITFSIKTDHTRDLKAIIDAAREFADKEFAGTGVEVNFSGSANNSYIWAKLLIDSQTGSILWSKLAILLLAAFLFRSPMMGLFTIVPVTLTTLFIAGFAGAAAIPLDVSTALAAGVAVGVGVDYAIHYIFRYRDEWRSAAGDHLTAARATARTVGKTIVFNATVVTAGFLILFLSQFPPHAKLGQFVVAYMVLSCVFALVLLPLLFHWYGGRKKGAAEEVSG